jgi:hypothetical protein
MSIKRRKRQRHWRITTERKLWVRKKERNREIHSERERGK